MRKKFPFKKVENKLDELYFQREALEREDAFPGNFYLQSLDERIDCLEFQLDAHAGGSRTQATPGTRLRGGGAASAPAGR